MSIAAHILMTVRANDDVTLRELAHVPPHYREGRGYGYALPSILMDLRDMGLLKILGEGEDAENINLFLQPNATVHITDRLAKLQSLLEISLKDLLESAQKKSISVVPSFGIPNTVGETDVFVLMPFSQDMLPIYEDHIRKAVQSTGMSCRRADDLFAPSEIMKEIWSSIFTAKFIVADCTGKNPNVFYEMGIAHTLGKPVIMLTQNDDDIPFDIRHRKYIRYVYNPGGMADLERTLATALEELRQTINKNQAS